MVNRNSIEEIINKSIVKCVSGKQRFINNFLKRKSSFMEEQITEDSPEYKYRKGVFFGVLEMKQNSIQEKVTYSPTEFGSVNNYTAQEYKIINGRIGDNEIYRKKYKERRKGNPSLDDWIDMRIENIDSAIDKSPRLTQDTILYRYGEIPLDISEGGVGKWKGYTSTTYQEETADRFKNGYDYDQPDRYKLKIYASEGTKGVLCNQQFEAIVEHEWLLPRNQRYQVLSVNHETKEAEIVLLPPSNEY